MNKLKYTTLGLIGAGGWAGIFWMDHEWHKYRAIQFREQYNEYREVCFGEGVPPEQYTEWSKDRCNLPNDHKKQFALFTTCVTSYCTAMTFTKYFVKVFK